MEQPKTLRAPFPWFGGKSRAAPLVWAALGDVANYVEPFAGSLAVLLARPSAPRVETVNGLDCYLDAVVHLYTMCRHVKSIEIIEFGFVKAQEGVNGAKSEYCVDKQKINITRPYQAALREAIEDELEAVMPGVLQLEAMAQAAAQSR